MKTSIGFRLSAVICAAVLFVGTFSFVSGPTQADGGTTKAAQDAEKAMGEAEQLAKDCDELKAKLAALEDAATNADNEKTKAENEADESEKDAKDEMSKIGAEKTDADKVADAAATVADTAAAAADAALDKKQEGATGKETTAGNKETASGTADGEAAKADEDIKDAAVQGKKQDAREKRKKRRAARRAARKARREADEAKLAAKKKCKEAEEKLKKAKEFIEELEKKLAAGAKDEESKDKLGKLKKRLKDLKDAAKPKEPPTPKEPPKSVEPPKPGILIPPSVGEAVQTKTANGLNIVTFDTVPGRIIVNLPDDIRAGDTISGTVFTEPKGSTDEEKAKNQGVLNGTVLDLGGTTIQAERPTFIWTPQIPQPNTPVRYELKIVEVLGQPTPRGMTQSGAFITSNPNMTPPALPLGAVITADPKMTPTFVIPQLGQQGRPIVITGPFDGNSSNTALNFNRDFEKNTESVSGGFGQLAESPRTAVFRASTNFTGPVAVTLKEGSVETKGTYRNVGVNLSAPKTNLLKGERTTLTVQVSGLEGITKDVPLQLDSKGVITMAGGNSQSLRSTPAEVNRDGTYTTTRAITGQQAGAFSVTGTVVTGATGGMLFNEPGAMNEDQCATMEGDAVKIKEKITEKEKELAGLPEAVTKTEKAIERCKKDLAEARIALEKALANLQVKQNLLDNAKKYDPPRAADYEKAVKDATTAVDEARAKVAELAKKCRDLERTLDGLGPKGKTLPGEIEDLKRRLKELEERLAAWKVEAEKKKPEPPQPPDPPQLPGDPTAPTKPPPDSQPEKPGDKTEPEKPWSPPDMPPWLEPWWQAVQNIVPGSEFANLPEGKDALGLIIQRLNKKIIQMMVDGAPEKELAFYEDLKTKLTKIFNGLKDK